MKIKSLRKEIVWFFVTILFFLTFLFFIGPPDFWDWVIAIADFSLTWIIISYAIKKKAGDKFDSDYLRKELIWFVFLLAIFLGLMLLLGSSELSELLIASLVFTLIWLLRSFLYNKYSNKKN